MGGHLSFNVKPKDDPILQELKKLTIEKVTEVLDFIKVQYNGTFLLTESEFEDVRFLVRLFTPNCQAFGPLLQNPTPLFEVLKVNLKCKPLQISIRIKIPRWMSMKLSLVSISTVMGSMTLKYMVRLILLLTLPNRFIQALRFRRQ